MPRSAPCRRPRWRSSRPLLPARARTGSASARSSTPCSRRWGSTPAAPPRRARRRRRAGASGGGGGRGGRGPPRAGVGRPNPFCGGARGARRPARPRREGRARAAARAGRCRRECPVGVQVESGVLVEGVVDAAFLEDGEGWTVVDFKTDVEIAGRLDEYRRQVGLYAEAVARATGVRTRGVLLRV